MTSFNVTTYTRSFENLLNSSIFKLYIDVGEFFFCTHICKNNYMRIYVSSDSLL
jgi:hypothetical protein